MVTSLDDAASPTPWAYDSNNNELDPKLKAAHRLAQKDPNGVRVGDVDSPLWSEEEHSAEPLLLRNLLSDEQIDDILREVSVDGVWPRGAEDCEETEKAVVLDPPCHRHRFAGCIDGASSSVGLSDELRSVAHHLAWTDEHVVLYMHMNDWFVRTHPVPWSLIRGGMESRPWMNGAIPVLDLGWARSDQSMKDVRCIELHHYAKGGGLVTPGHRDMGSVLTISVLLSHPAEVSGGDFVTYRDGVPIAHKMERGDAILFNSESLHNISTVTCGLRQSLVVELWP